MKAPTSKTSSAEVEGAALAEDSAMQEPGAKVGAAPGIQARQRMSYASRAVHGMDIWQVPPPPAKARAVAG